MRFITAKDIPPISRERHLEDVLSDLKRYGLPRLFSFLGECGERKGKVTFKVYVEMRVNAPGMKSETGSDHHECPLAAALECESRIQDALRQISNLLCVEQA